jgi:hypothetical protein
MRMALPPFPEAALQRQCLAMEIIASFAMKLSGIGLRLRNRPTPQLKATGTRTASWRAAMDGSVIPRSSARRIANPWCFIVKPGAVFRRIAVLAEDMTDVMDGRATAWPASHIPTG